MIDVVDCNMYKNADDPTDLPIMYNAIERVTNDLSEFLQSLIDQPIERDYRINAIIAVMGGIKKHSVLAEYVVTDQHDLNHIQNSATLRIDAWTEHIDRVAFG